MSSTHTSQSSTDKHRQDEYAVARGIVRALNALHIHVPTATAFRMAGAIVRCMSGEHRVYHNVKHVFDVVPQDPEDDPLAHLAAVFHDVVHLKVDGAIPPCILPFLVRAGLIPLPHEEHLPGLREHNRQNQASAPVKKADKAPNAKSGSRHAYTRSDSGVRPDTSGITTITSSSSSNGSDSGSNTGLKPRRRERAKATVVRSDLPQLVSDGSLLARDRAEALCRPKSLALLALSHPREAGPCAFAVADEVLSWWTKSATAFDLAMQKRREVAQTICYQVFGHQPGQVLHLSPDTPGLSEFLSCVVAMDLLSPWLDELLLLHVCACIEATIPFRAPGCFDQLWLRCMQIAVEDIECFGQLSRMSIASHVHTAVESACRMASRDVGNFASQDTREFLTNTWALLPELNPALRSPRTFTLRRWMQALAGNIGFFEFLGRQPERVFHRFGDSHSKEEHEQVLHRVRTNLQRGRMYMGARLVTAGIIHALKTVADANGETKRVTRGMGGLVPSNTLGTVRVLLVHADGSRTLDPLTQNDTDTEESRSRSSSTTSVSSISSCEADGVDACCSTCNSGSAVGIFDFNDQGAEDTAHVEQLLLQGFCGNRGMMEKGQETGAGMYFPLCEASACVMRSLTTLGEESEQGKGSSECFEQCLQTVLAYLRDEIPAHALLKFVPYDCVEYVATHVVAYSLDHVQRAALIEWLEC